jgi:predicted enzyme related to lactoylglutathione lyase
MIHGALVRLVLLFLPLACTASGSAPDDPGEAHGIFTGEMKSVIYVRDVEASMPFYRDVLGFGFEGFAGDEAGPYYAELSVAGVKFCLHEPMSSGQEANIGRSRLYFRVKDVAAHRSRVLARGADAGEIRQTDWMDMFLVRDPDGNEIIFALTDPEHHSIYPWNTGKPVATPPEPTDLEAHLWSLEERYLDGIRDGRLDEVRQFLHPGFLGWPSHSARPVDAMTARASLESLLEGIRIISMEMKSRVLNLTGHIAVTHYIVESSYEDRDGTPGTSLLRITHTWLETPDGWKIIGGMSAEQ